MTEANELKSIVREHWERETCGTRYAEASDRSRYFEEISSARYHLEPFIVEFANFPSAAGKTILEIGVGAGADFSQWCKYAHFAEGIDLTEAGIALTTERLQIGGIPTDRFRLQVGDAEALPFADDAFDIVYSWGVLHHTPDTESAFREAYRVLKPDGELRCMIYHVRSWTAWMLAGRRALHSRSIRKFSPKQAVFEELESPGTKAFTLDEAKTLVRNVGFERIEISTKLGPGDLLTIRPSERYCGRWFRVAWKLYPRPLIRALGDRFGLDLMITASKLLPVGDASAVPDSRRVAELTGWADRAGVRRDRRGPPDWSTEFARWRICGVLQAESWLAPLAEHEPSSLQPRSCPKRRWRGQSSAVSGRWSPFCW